jgi:Helix-turn-helix domain
MNSSRITEAEPRDNSLVSFPLRLARARDITRKGLSRTAIQVWSNLCEHRNAPNEAYPKVTTLATGCGISRRTVQYGLAELERHEWIGTLEGNRGGGAHRGTKYHLHPVGKACERCIAADQHRNRSRGANPAPLKIGPGGATYDTQGCKRRHC